MSPLPPFRRLFRLGLRSTRRQSQDIDDELDAHVAMRVDFLRSTGLTDEEARAEAARRFGDVATTRNALMVTARKRAQRLRLRELLDGMALDGLFALRQLRRSPRSALFGITSLSLGIGLATAFFAAVNGVLLRPLPYRDAERLVALQPLDSAGNVVPVVSADDWYDWKTRNRTFSGIALHGIAFRMPIVVHDQPLRVSTVSVTPGYFTVLGARLRLGRDFNSTDAHSHDAVIIGQSLWKRAFGAQPLPLTVRMGDVERTVVGVVSGGQEFPAETELWLPYAHTPIGGAARNNVNWFAVGRLDGRHGMGVAEDDLTRIARGIRAASPEALYSFGVRVTPLRDQLVSGARLYLRLLLGAVVCVLLIASVNLASINLARGTARAREMAVRAAIGANRGRLMRQLLVEHLVMAMLGSALGVIVAWGAVRGIVSMASTQLPRVNDIAIDGRVLLFAAAATIAVGLLTGLLPALQAGRTSLAGSMAAVGRGTARGWTAAGRMLVASEIALAVVLAVGGGLLLQSFREVLATPLGYETSGVVTAELSLTGQRYRTDSLRMRQFWTSLLTAVRASPRVAAAGTANWIPLGLGGQSFIEVEGNPLRQGGGYRVVSDGYFATMKIALLSGRDFREADVEGSPRVGLVNRRMAEAFWPGENPIGKRLRAPSMEPQPKGKPASWITVIGVVGDVRQWGAETEARPELYVHVAQLPGWWTTLTVAVRSSAPANETASMLRARLRALDPLIAADIEPFVARLERTNADRRFTMSLLLLFGVLALALAAIGVYSVLAFQVAMRTREFAVRAALGAERRLLLQHVLASGARIILAGIGAGVLVALALSRVMQAFVFGVSAHDPSVMTASVAVIVVVAFAAAFVPALRATRVEPMLALQQE